MSQTGFAPGWVARCPACPYEVDLASLGWIRIGAYSWGKRTMLPCPDYGRRRCMRVVHVDENGQPDQPLGLVLRKVLALQMRIWLWVLSGLGVTAVVVLAVLKKLGVDLPL